MTVPLKMAPRTLSQPLLAATMILLTQCGARIVRRLTRSCLGPETSSIQSILRFFRPVYGPLWGRDGRNDVRYVSQDEVAELKKDIAGYQMFTKLAEQYADEVIRATRCERENKKRGVKAKP